MLTLLLLGIFGSLSDFHPMAKCFFSQEAGAIAEPEPCATSRHWGRLPRSLQPLSVSGAAFWGENITPCSGKPCLGPAEGVSVPAPRGILSACLCWVVLVPQARSHPCRDRRCWEGPGAGTLGGPRPRSRASLRPSVGLPTGQHPATTTLSHRVRCSAPEQGTGSIGHSRSSAPRARSPCALSRAGAVNAGASARAPSPGTLGRQPVSAGAGRGSGSRGKRRAGRTTERGGGGGGGRGKRPVPLLLCPGGEGGCGGLLPWKGPRARAAGGLVQVRWSGEGGPGCTKMAGDSRAARFASCRGRSRGRASGAGRAAPGFLGRIRKGHTNAQGGKEGYTNAASLAGVRGDVEGLFQQRRDGGSRSPQRGQDPAARTASRGSAERGRPNASHAAVGIPPAPPLLCGWTRPAR
ncbi:uncharacterized PE-PGRS family protein PE_PGRS54-like [Falco peregrinus]|uniref:uncharacterized PE-PGRS family protein PE_PGRS54-like n=1 Tax=Falco peregrinus TaxID=8954 RepID=UPI00247AF165|nr:uncharacterized PE-PGRS family protein PE_PGRS54-like [Falco peregrinus]